MSILAKNIKMIRRELRCTQSTLADIIKVGFRTYVRYEAGERDAPVSVLVKMARLGNISLEQLLTREIGKNDIAPVKMLSKNAGPVEVRSVNFRAGEVVFKKNSKQELMTIDDSEKKLVTLFRKMTPEMQKLCLDHLGKTLETGKVNPLILGRGGKARTAGRAGTGVAKKSGKAAAGTMLKARKKGKPGRKKLNKKLLKEKIDKLKMITQSINKITVR